MVSALALSGCELTDEEKEKLDNAAVDLQQLADQIIITYPAKDSEITNSMVTVRADIPASAQAQEVRLLVDGIEIAKDSDGAPWEIQWPAYYFADGSKHTLLLKTITGEGNEVRNNEQFQVTVKEEANEALTFDEGINGSTIQDQGSLHISFAAFEGAVGYEVLLDGQLISTNTAELELSNLSVGTHTVQYRALHDGFETTPFSNQATFQVLPATLPIINEAIIDGIEVTLSWEAISEGDSYDIYWGEEGSLEIIESTNATSYTISELGIGNFEWSIRRTNILGQQSEMSPLGMVELLAPALPALNEVLIEKTESGYQATLSWEEMGVGDQYEIFWGAQGNLLSSATIQGSMHVLYELTPGNYEYALQRTNSLGQKSLISEAAAIDIGIFRTQLGGSGDDTARKLITSSLGGYLILGNTKSPDVSPSLSGNDDWVIHIGEDGEVINEFISSATTINRFNDIYESEGGSIYLAGYDSHTDGGVLIKLTPELELVWEEYFNPEDQADSYRFNSIAEWNGELYVSATQTGTYTFENLGEQPIQEELLLHTVDRISGAISIPQSLQGVTSIKSYKTTLITTLESGNLLISGRGWLDLNGYPVARAYFSIINDELDSVNYWISEGDFEGMVWHSESVQLSNGKLAISGTPEFGGGMVRIFNDDGTFHEVHNFPVEYSTPLIAPTMEGGFLSYYQDIFGDEIEELISKVSEGGAVTKVSQTSEPRSQVRQIGIINNYDNTVTILLSTNPIDSNDFNLIIKRIPITNEQ